MNTTLRKDADQIIAASLKAVLPDEAVFRALKSFRPGTGRTPSGGCRKSCMADGKCRRKGTGPGG